MNSNDLSNLDFALNSQLINSSKSSEYLEDFIYLLTKLLSCFSILIFKKNEKNIYEPNIIKPKNFFDMYPAYKFRLSKALEFFYDKDILTIDNNNFHLFEMENYGYMIIHSKNRKFHKKIIEILQKSISNFTHIYLLKIQNEENIININTQLKQARTITQAKIITQISKSFTDKTNNINNSTTQLKINQKYNKLNDEILINCINELYNNNDAIIRNINMFKSLSTNTIEKNKFTLNYIINKLENILKYTLEENNIKFVKNIEDIEIYTYENGFLEALFNIYDYIINSFKLQNIDTKIIYTSIIIKDNNPIIYIYTNKKINNEENLQYLFNSNVSLDLYFSKNLISKQINGIINVKLSNFTHEDILYEGLKFTIELKE